MVRSLHILADELDALKLMRGCIASMVEFFSTLVAMLLHASLGHGEIVAALESFPDGSFSSIAALSLGDPRRWEYRHASMRRLAWRRLGGWGDPREGFVLTDSCFLGAWRQQRQMISFVTFSMVVLRYACSCFSLPVCPVEPGLAYTGFGGVARVKSRQLPEVQITCRSESWEAVLAAGRAPVAGCSRHRRS